MWVANCDNGLAGKSTGIETTASKSYESWLTISHIMPSAPRKYMVKSHIDEILNPPKKSVVSKTLINHDMIDAAYQPRNRTDDKDVAPVNNG